MERERVSGKLGLVKEGEIQVLKGVKGKGKGYEGLWNYNPVGMGYQQLRIWREERMRFRTRRRLEVFGTAEFEFPECAPPRCVLPFQPPILTSSDF